MAKMKSVELCAAIVILCWIPALDGYTDDGEQGIVNKELLKSVDNINGQDFRARIRVDRKGEECFSQYSPSNSVLYINYQVIDYSIENRSSPILQHSAFAVFITALTYSSCSGVSWGRPFD